MTNENIKQKNIPSKPENNFSGAIGGKNLKTVNMAAPHQELLQRSVGIELRKIFTDKKSGGDIEIVKIGTGAGLTSLEILEADKRIKVISMDNEPKMISEARKNLKDQIDSGRIKIAEQDALVFLKALLDNSVDAVASGFTLHNFNRVYRREVLEEVFRCIRPGGCFINADKYVPDDKDEYEKEYSWQIEQFKKADVSGEIKEGWLKHYEADSNPEVIMRTAEAVKLMEEIGFKDIKISDRHHLDALLEAWKK